MALNITGHFLECLGVYATTVEYRFTTAVLEVLATGTPALRVTGASMEYIGVMDPALDATRVTQQYLEVLCTWSPRLTWIGLPDMFANEVFPKDISFNSIGATKFMTDVVMVDSGDDQRVSRWDDPLMEYDVSYGVRTMEDLHALLWFFRAMRGRLYSFLYDDHVDNSSTQATALDARAAPAISSTDQLIALGDGSTSAFQLIKSYSALAGTTQVRPITKPKPGTLLISVEAVDKTNFNVDPLTGIVQFITDLQKYPLNGMVATMIGSILHVTGPNGSFTGFNVSDRVVMNGWLNAVNNFTEDDEVYVQGTDPTNHAAINFTVPAGKGIAEGSRNNVNLYRHPAPVSGLHIRAGYRFFVPVRFDTDRLPVTLEEYGVGGANDVKLIEVRDREDAL